MYPHYHHQPSVDPTSNAVSGSLYQQPRHVGQQYHHPMTHHPTVPTQAPARHAVYQPPPQAAAPPEPLPSASDVQHTLGLNLPHMAEFASSMVYLMWHARRPSVMALHDASKLAGAPSAADHDAHQSRETADIANATSSAFKKFSRQILHATQLSESVVMLSLKYIAMLLQRNPNIQGAEGSEYRLFTVALMLANKFLDDNTFTNKTWSDVSGMKVTDLNIMELEFLDVLHFGLFVKKDEFERWKVALVNFKNQLHSVYQAQEQQQRQKMIEASLKSVGLSMLQPQEQTWPGSTHDMPRQPQQQQQQQQPPAGTPTQQQPAANMQQQYHQQYLYLLSKAQQPQFPTQPINQPLARVPLRIPAQPVYMNAAAYSSSHVPPQPQQTAPVQAQQPPSQSAAAVYDAPVVVTSTAANVAPPPPSQHYAVDPKRAYPPQPQQPHAAAPAPAPSQIDTQYPPSSQYASRQPPSASKSTTTRPMYDSYGRPTPADGNEPMYPGTFASLQSTPAYTAAAAPHPAYSHPASAAAPPPPPAQAPPPAPSAVTNAVLRSTSTPGPTSSGHDYTMGGVNSSSSLQPPQTASSSRYYYATPSATPTSAHADNAQTAYGAYGNGVSVPRPVRSYYLESPAHPPAQPPQHQQIATPATTNVDYQAYAMSSAAAHQPIVSAPDPYGAQQQRPAMMRTPSSTAGYQQYPPPSAPVHPSAASYGKSYPTRHPQHHPSAPPPHQPPPPPPSASTASEDYSGPMPEDPLTAAESYRTNRR